MLNLAPSANSAPLARQLGSHALTQAYAMARNPEQFVVIWLFPLLGLLLGFYLRPELDLTPSSVTASAVGLAVFSTSFTTVALTTDHRTFDRLAATPLGKAGLSVGTALAIWLIIAAQLALIFLAASWLGWQPQHTASGLLLAFVAALLAMVTFTSLGLLAANLEPIWLRLVTVVAVFLGGTFLGGLAVPISAFPESAQPILWLLPTGAFGETLRQGSMLGLLILIGWCLLAGFTARRFLRWLS